MNAHLIVPVYADSFVSTHGDHAIILRRVPGVTVADDGSWFPRHTVDVVFAPSASASIPATCLQVREVRQ